jgi:hypothetical protein
VGTDYLELLDRRTAEVVIRADESDLISLVESRTTSDGIPVWKSYWNAERESSVDFERATKAAERLKTQLHHGRTLEEIKDELLWEICIGGRFLYLDYWGCWVEAFPVEGPPGAVPWDEFTVPIRAVAETNKEASGGYLLTDANAGAIIRSLTVHRNELTIMGDPEIDQLRRWRAFCLKHPGFCILYQIDF